MAISNFIEEIRELIQDSHDTKFINNLTKVVPNVNDTDLTWKFGEDKKGKQIETCILFVDIRDSVKLVEKHHFSTMSKVYSAFIKSVIKAAHYHNGNIRNIIGDRVMIVFPSENCFTNAVECAISINHICENVINSTFSGVDFKCGIGIDYGKMNVIKVGVEKHGPEHSDNKNLVWVGYPANKASRLTDVANKNINETYFEVFKEVELFNRDLNTFVKRQKKIVYTSSDIAELLYSSNGTTIYMNEFDKIKSFEKKKRIIEIPPILMTEVVYKGYKKENPTCNTIVENHWEKLNYPIKNISENVFGGKTTWKV